MEIEITKYGERIGKWIRNEFGQKPQKKELNWGKSRLFFFYYPSSFEWEQVNNRYEGFLFSGRERFGFSPPPSVSVGILIKRVGGCRARRPLTSPILIPLKDDKRSFFFFLLTLSTSKLISFVPHMLGNRHETSSWEGALDWEQRRHTFALGNVERKKQQKNDGKTHKLSACLTGRQKGWFVYSGAGLKLRLKDVRGNMLLFVF